MKDTDSAPWYHMPRRAFLGAAAGVWSALAARPSPARAQSPVSAGSAVGADDKLRIIVFGAHPDDCELSSGGTAAKWAEQGHHVKFVSCTNGDIGHWRMAGGPLARRRKAEVKQCGGILGAEVEVLDIHDGELTSTMDNRRTLCRLIRQWQADIVISHRPNDYHPDHRCVGVLVCDAAYMVTVPFFCPDAPALARNPLFLFSKDDFQRPNPFTPDLAVSIDDVVEKKLAAIDALESQFYEGGANGGPHLVPDPNDPAAVAARKKQVRDRFKGGFAATANRFRAALVERYGSDRAAKVQFAEAFEICEYGRQPSKEELHRLFPFFG